jgi:phosphatidate cytidylyltransferase
VNGDSAQQGHKSRKSGLFLRVASAVVLIPPVIGAIYLGSPYFDILIVVGALVLCWEWFMLCRPQVGWLLAGIPYIIVPSYALLFIRHDPDMGLETIMWVFLIVWATDTFAYAAGRTFGGPKLAPRISPNKTWSGLIGGATGAGIVGVITALVLDHDSVIPLALISAALGALSQGGDLVESWIKRKFGKKDAGSLIPGHGGLFDRVDGLLVAALIVALADVLSSRGSILTWV